MIEPIDWIKLNSEQRGKTYDDALHAIMEVVINKMNEIVEDYNARCQD